MVHLSATCLYVRILRWNDMHCIDCPLVFQLYICQNPNRNDMDCLDGTLVCQLSVCQNLNRKWYVFPRWSNCLPTVYMSESYQEMPCIAQIVHLYANCLYVRSPTGNDMYCLDGPLVCHLSICQNPNRKWYVLPPWYTCLPAVYMSYS